VAYGLTTPWLSVPNPVVQLGGTSVNIVDYFPDVHEVSSITPCPVNYVSTTQIWAKLPASIKPGRHFLLVTISNPDSDEAPNVVEPH
jgi:hypothetical protein